MFIIVGIGESVLPSVKLYAFLTKYYEFMLLMHTNDVNYVRFNYITSSFLYIVLFLKIHIKK